MKLYVISAAEQDLGDGYWFYERQSSGLGDYFRSCLFADLESLIFHAGIHELVDGYYRSLAKRFPYSIYYELDSENIIVVAVLDSRRNPMWTRKRLEQ